MTSDRARAYVESYIDRTVGEREATWSRLVRKGWATYVEEGGVLEIRLTDAGEARAAELRLLERQGRQ